MITGFVPCVGLLRDKMGSRVFRKLGCSYVHLEPIDFDCKFSSRFPLFSYLVQRKVGTSRAG